MGILKQRDEYQSNFPTQTLYFTKEKGVQERPVET